MQCPNYIDLPYRTFSRALFFIGAHCSVVKRLHQDGCNNAGSTMDKGVRRILVKVGQCPLAAWVEENFENLMVHSEV